MAVLDAHPTPALADELVATWLARSPTQIAAAVETAHLDTLCVLSTALARRGRVDALDAPRQLLARRCAGDRKFWGDNHAAPDAAAAIALRGMDLARATPQAIAVVDALLPTAITRAVADGDVARLLAAGLLRHVELEAFLAMADGRTVWLLALALQAPTVDDSAVALALRLLERGGERPEAVDRMALAATLAARWKEDGAYLYLNDELWDNSGDEAQPPLIRTDTWAKFVAAAELAHAEDRVAPAWWRARPLAERAALAAESQARRYRNDRDWAAWLVEQQRQLAAGTSAAPAR
ncbi:MAG: hypothetical protein JNK64_03185 [Myxococcales bacterium]|nr:hypothetical protein [Myxococcales bacterium]